jgi:hypothetical protein
MRSAKRVPKALLMQQKSFLSTYNRFKTTLPQPYGSHRDGDRTEQNYRRFL